MTNENDSFTLEEVALTKAQKALLEKGQELGWGKSEVTWKDGQPVMFKIIEQDFKLD